MEVEDSRSFRRIFENLQVWVYIRRILRVQKKCGFIAKYLRLFVPFCMRSSRPGDREYLYRKVQKRLVYVASANKAQVDECTTVHHDRRPRRSISHIDRRRRHRDFLTSLGYTE